MPPSIFVTDFPYSSVGKESSCKTGDPSLIPGSGISPGEEIGYPLQYSWASLVAQLVKNLPTKAGDGGLIPGLEKIPWEWNGNPIQYSCLGNPVDRGAWWAAIHGIVRVGCDLVTEQQYLLRYFCILLIIYLLLYLEKRVACNKQLQFLFHLVSTIWIWSSSPD